MLGESNPFALRAQAVKRFKLSKQMKAAGQQQIKRSQDAMKDPKLEPYKKMLKEEDKNRYSGYEYGTGKKFKLKNDPEKSPKGYRARLVHSDNPSKVSYLSQLSYPNHSLARLKARAYARDLRYKLNDMDEGRINGRVPYHQRVREKEAREKRAAGWEALRSGSYPKKEEEQQQNSSHDVKEAYSPKPPKKYDFPMEVETIVKERAKKHIAKLNKEDPHYEYSYRFHYKGPRKPTSPPSYSRPASTPKSNARGFSIAIHRKRRGTMQSYTDRHGRKIAGHKGDHIGYIRPEHIGVKPHATKHLPEGYRD